MGSNKDDFDSTSAAAAAAAAEATAAEELRALSMQVSRLQATVDEVLAVVGSAGKAEAEKRPR